MLSAENTVWLFRSNNGGTAVESIDIVTGQRREAPLSYNAADFAFKLSVLDGTDDGCYMLSAENTVWLFRSNNGGTAVESIDIVTGQRREAALSYNAADFAFKLSVLDGARLCVTASGMTRDEFYIEIFSPSCERTSFLRYGAVPTESIRRGPDGERRPERREAGPSGPRKAPPSDSGS